MIPFGLNEEQFSARYWRELDRVSPTAIASLRSLLVREVNPDVHSANVEIFLDQYGGAPGIWIYYRGENNKVDRSEQALFAGRSLEFDFPLDALAGFDERYFISLDDGDNEFPGLFLAGNALKAWFAECWWKAGGWAYSVPATLSVHDDRGDGNVVQLTEAGR